MVVLVMLGTAGKLAVAVGLSYRTRTWWLPGAAAIAGGAASLALPVFPRIVGASAIGLGAAALVVARRLHVPSKR
ncbi:MAG: hypothetical protein JO257_07755 [Deltaproteobacteria bacterium]|nr:hypothetical protein [Deltaproteobacteria bacterium]